MAEPRLARAWYSGATWLWLLRPLELLYRLVVGVRRSCYRHGILPVYVSPVPVIMVGNITAGGTGKTPVVMSLVAELQASGRSVGVVSRGYGGSSNSYPLLVEPDTPATECGDEPLLMRRATGCSVAVDPNRPRAVRRLLAETDVDVVISDDGLQHYALGRDFELVLIDGKRLLGNGWCLPAGPLREPPTRVSAADAVIYRDGSSEASSFHYAPGELMRLVDGTNKPFSPTAVGEEVYGVAGIGQPDQFFLMLEEAGFRVRRRPFPDHHAFTAADFKDMTDLPIIMTAKDAVKCVRFAGPGAWQLTIRAVLPDGVLARITECLESQSMRKHKA